MMLEGLVNAWSKAVTDRRIKRLQHQFHEHAILREDGARKLLADNMGLSGEQQQRLLDIMADARTSRYGDNNSFFPGYYVDLLKHAKNLTPEVQIRLCDVLAANENESTPFMVSELLAGHGNFSPAAEERLCGILTREQTEDHANLAVKVLDSARDLGAPARNALITMIGNMSASPDARFFRFFNIGRLLNSEQPLSAAEQKKLAGVYDVILRNNPFKVLDTVDELASWLRSEKLAPPARQKIIDSIADAFSYDAPVTALAVKFMLQDSGTYRLTSSEAMYLKAMYDQVVPVIQRTAEENAYLQKTQPALYELKLQTCFAPPDSPLLFIAKPASDMLPMPDPILMMIPSNSGYGPN